MTKKISQTILSVGLAVVILSTALSRPPRPGNLPEGAFGKREAGADLAAQGVALGGIRYLEDLDAANRLTWIDSDGTVLYDSQANEDAMENHLAREEVQEALATGHGRSSRLSATLATRTLYVAVALEDGTLLRLASEQSSVADLLLSLIPSMAAILLVMAALAVFLAHRLSRNLIRPILSLDLEHPENCDTYEELTPLLRRLHSQQETISAQIAELKRQQNEFTAITENMSEGFLLMDSHTNLLSCNSSALRLLGAEIANSGESVFHLSRAEPFLHVVEEALAGRHSEALLEREGRYYQLLANPVMRDGRLAGAVLAILDVTERENREALRREFSANVSHELKTPLTSISGFAELMKSGMVPQETVPEFAGDIYREAQRLITLVEDIIHLSQLDEGAVPMDREEIDLHALARDVLDRLAPAAEKGRVQLRLDGEKAVVTGVRHVVDEMVFNLADNAVKYNRPGGSVTITTGMEKGKPWFSVADTGIGIPADSRERVFERFYRVDKSHSKDVGGTGLGLSIVKHAAAYLGASLELRSEVGEGTTVTARWN